MKKIFFFFLLINRMAWSQDSTFYAKVDRVGSLDSCDRFEVGQLEESSQLYLVRFYDFKNKVAVLKEESRFKDRERRGQEGAERSFDKDGSVDVESFYKDGKKEGRSVSLYKNGKIYHEMFYKSGKRDGNLKVYHPNGQIKRDEMYKDNVWIIGKTYDSTGVEIPNCGEFERQPQFLGGIPAFYKFLEKNIKFPKEAMKDRKFRGGKVYTTFVVGSNGTIKDVEVVKGLHPACDVEAVRVVLSMPPWVPGYQDCKPVNVKYNVSISFTLE